MRLSFLFLLILVCHDASTTTAPLYIPSTLSACFNEKYISNYDASYRSHVFKKYGFSYEVYGLTPFCYVYVGWLNTVMDSNMFNTQLSGKVMNVTSTACKDKQIVQMVTEGQIETVLLVIDRFGQKIRIQSAANSPMHGEPVNGMMWLKFAPNDRRQQFYTNKVGKGFVIQSILRNDNRVFVLCVSFEETRIYELKVFLDKNELKPYLKTRTDDSFSIKPNLVTPTIGLNARNVLDLYITGREEVPIIHKSRSGGEVYKGTEFRGITSIGLAFLHKSNAVNPMSNVAPALPLQSLVADSLIGYNGGYTFDSNLLFRGYFGVTVLLPTKDDQCARMLRSAMIYSHEYSGDLSARNRRNEYYEQEPKTVLYAVSKRYYINRQSHRRMSYPLTFNRNMDRHNLDVGWAECAPVLFGTIGVIVLVGAVIKIIMRRKEKEEHRKGVTTSLSNAYSL